MSLRPISALLSLALLSTACASTSTPPACGGAGQPACTTTDRDASVEAATDAPRDVATDPDADDATPQCAASELLCDGRCVDATTDALHCGECGHACPSGQVCRSGTCICNIPGQIYCAGSGCINPQTDPNNCGRCGVVCVDRMCRPGGCDLCTLGLSVCPGLGCINLQTDHANCGACGNVCPESTPRCVASVCVA